jgi:hypothetical protein
MGLQQIWGRTHTFRARGNCTLPSFGNPYTPTLTRLLCTPTHTRLLIHAYSARLLLHAYSYTPTLHAYSTRLLYTPTLHAYSTRLLYTPTLHAYTTRLGGVLLDLHTHTQARTLVGRFSSLQWARVPARLPLFLSRRLFCGPKAIWLAEGLFS